jgi:hypothetical protein
MSGRHTDNLHDWPAWRAALDPAAPAMPAPTGDVPKPADRSQAEKVVNCELKRIL